MRRELQVDRTSSSWDIGESLPLKTSSLCVTPSCFLPHSIASSKPE